MITTTNDAMACFDDLRRLFHGELAQVQFPGLDAKVLDTAAARIEEARAEVRRCEGELEAARALLAGAQEEALGKGQRALAYARVYAQDDSELLARLDGIALTTGTAPVASAAPAPRKRGRPPKSATVTPLFGEDAPAAEMAAD
jgi:hypothetical protein